MKIVDRIRSGKPTLLDGAMGTELDRRGVPLDVVAWSARAMESHPYVVREVHADYVRAGADLHIVNSFATCRHVLEAAGLADKVEAYNRLAVSLCQDAIEQASDGREQWIAGSISTYAESSDRSRLPPLQRLRKNYQEQAMILADAGVDMLVLEMLFDVEASVAALEAAAATGLPVSIGFTCRFGADNETVEPYVSDSDSGADFELQDVLLPVVAAIPTDTDAIVAIMHSEFDVTDKALEIANDLWNGPIAVYPNSGLYEQPYWRFDTVCSSDEFANAAERWLRNGAIMIGGCCGIGPDHIRALVKRLDT